MWGLLLETAKINTRAGACATVKRNRFNSNDACLSTLSLSILSWVFVMRIQRFAFGMTNLCLDAVAVSV